jgi:hypothetical protein
MAARAFWLLATDYAAALADRRRAINTKMIAKNAPEMSARKSLTRACLVERGICSNSIPPQSRAAKTNWSVNERRWPKAKTPPTIANAVRCSGDWPAPVTGRSTAGTKDKVTIAIMPIHVATCASVINALPIFFFMPHSFKWPPDVAPLSTMPVYRDDTITPCSMRRTRRPSLSISLES